MILQARGDSLREANIEVTCKAMGEPEFSWKIRRRKWGESCSQISFLVCAEEGGKKKKKCYKKKKKFPNHFRCESTMKEFSKNIPNRYQKIFQSMK